MLGLCAPPAGELGEHGELEQLAARHVREIRGAQPDGPYLIVGECTGERSRMRSLSSCAPPAQEVALLALVDAFAPGSATAAG